jgi:hypothetical protein
MQAGAGDFFEFVSGASLRFLQERDVGLDIYLSGWSALVPTALGVAAATVFFLALFHVVPRRAQSIPILLGISLIAAVIGLVGSYFNYAHYIANPDGPYARAITDGKGVLPVRMDQLATLLCLPFLVGLGVVAECVGWSLFLLLFGGRDGSKSGGSARIEDASPQIVADRHG